MKILVTGANGFLGYYLVKQLLDRNFHVIATGRSVHSNHEIHENLVYKKMDFTDPFEVHDVFEVCQPEVVIHSGALSSVDLAETEQWLAFAANVEGSLNVLSNAASFKSHLVFVSTDFVFDGQKGFYSENDERAPVNFYGKTKVDGEDAVMEYEHEWAIVRTSLVYGKALGGKQNVLSVTKEKILKGEPYGLVNDQFRSPTFVEDLAAGIILIIEKKAKGIFHLSGKNILTPYQMGQALVSHLHADPSLIKELTSKNFTQSAMRPVRTNLNIAKAVQELGYQPLSFEEGLKKTIG